MRVTIDRDRCAGHGLCYIVAPDVFTDDPDGYGRLALDGELAGVLVASARCCRIVPGAGHRDHHRRD
jgi:ferredoxin